LKLRDLENTGECRVILDSKTEDPVRLLHYTSDRKLMFMASLDGKFQCWKLPTEWRDSKVEKMEEDFILERKTLARV
jgi:hypothetical protein